MITNLVVFQVEGRLTDLDKAIQSTGIRPKSIVGKRAEGNTARVTITCYPWQKEAFEKALEAF